LNQEWAGAIVHALIGVVFAAVVLTLYIRWRKKRHRGRMKRSRSMFWVISAFASFVAILEFMAIRMTLVGKMVILLGVATLWLVGILCLRKRAS
jgi:hypothetical protein